MERPRLIPFLPIINSWGERSTAGPWLDRRQRVCDPVGVFAFRPLLEYPHPPQLRGILYMRASARAVIHGTHLDDPQPLERGRYELEKRPIPDLVVDVDSVLLENRHVLGCLDHPVAFVLDPLEVPRGEIRRLEVHACAVRVQLVSHGPRSVDSPDEAGHQMLRRVESHVFVQPVPVDNAVHFVRRRHPVHVVLDDPLFLRHAKDLRYLVGPSEDPRVIWLPAALGVESGLVEDHEVRSALDDRGVEITQIAWIRLLSAALRHVEHARRHGPRNEGPPYRIRPFRVVTMRPQPINRPSPSAALWSRLSRGLAPRPSRW